MKRILMVMFEGGGNVPPQLGIARELLSRGHRVRILGDRALAEDVAKIGAEFSGWRTAPHQHFRSKESLVRDWEAKSPIGALKKISTAMMFGPAPAYARDTLDEIAGFDPDALVVDFMMMGAAVAAEKSGRPTALIMHTVSQLPLEGYPPFGFGLLPARGWLGRLRDQLLGALATRTLDNLGLPHLNPLREKLSLAPLRHVTDQLLRCARGLLLTSPAFDFPAKGLPEHIRYAGAPIDDPVWTEAPPALDDDRPLVLVALGSTFQNQLALTQRVVDALGTLPVRGLVTLGNVFAPSELRAPDNVRVVASAPHGPILSRARITVAHGGHGTVVKSLAAGVPVLCIPLGRDQGDNAARLRHSGAGWVLSPKSKGAAIGRTLQRLLDERSFADNARRMQALLARERCAQTAADEIEAISGRARDRGAPAPTPDPDPPAPLESVH